MDGQAAVLLDRVHRAGGDQGPAGQLAERRQHVASATGLRSGRDPRTEARRPEHAIEAAEGADHREVGGEVGRELGPERPALQLGHHRRHGQRLDGHGGAGRDRTATDHADRRALGDAAHAHAHHGHREGRPDHGRDLQDRGLRLRVADRVVSPLQERADVVVAAQLRELGLDRGARLRGQLARLGEAAGIVTRRLGPSAQRDGAGFEVPPEPQRLRQPELEL